MQTVIVKCNHNSDNELDCDSLGCDENGHVCEDIDTICGEEISFTVYEDTEGGIGRHFQRSVIFAEIDEQVCDCEHSDYELEKLREKAIADYD